MTRAGVQLHLTLAHATNVSPRIVRHLVRAAHGSAGGRAEQLLAARRLVVELLAKIDVAGDALDRGELAADDRRLQEPA